MDWPSLSPDAIVEKAREYVGTPWHLDARLKGIGIDCFGLIVAVFDELGAPVEDVRGYTGGDDWGKLTAAVDPFTEQLWGDGHPRTADWVRGFLRPGDILLFRNVDLPAQMRILCHCAIYTGDGIIHAWNLPTVAGVTEHPIDAYWCRCIAQVRRYRGVSA